MFIPGASVYTVTSLIDEIIVGSGYDIKVVVVKSPATKPSLSIITNLYFSDS